MTSALAFPHPLSDAEQRIRDGKAQVVQGYQNIGRALREIHDARLYLHTGHTSFKAYVFNEWGWTKQRAHQLINAEQLATLLLDAGLEPPDNERTARPLTKHDLSPEAQILVWRVVSKAAADGNGRVTNKGVEGVIAVLQEVTRTGALNVDGEAVEVAEAFQVMVSDETYYNMLEQKKTLPGQRRYYGEAVVTAQHGNSLTIALEGGLEALGVGEKVRVSIYTVI